MGRHYDHCDMIILTNQSNHERNHTVIILILTLPNHLIYSNIAHICLIVMRAMISKVSRRKSDTKKVRGKNKRNQTTCLPLMSEE